MVCYKTFRYMLTPAIAFSVLVLLTIPVPPVIAQQGSVEYDPADYRITAKFVERAPALDGRLDDPEWLNVEPATGFTQREPGEGAPAERDATFWDVQLSPAATPSRGKPGQWASTLVGNRDAVIAREILAIAVRRFAAGVRATGWLADL